LYFFEIFAPYLQHLEISRDLYDLKCMLVNVSAAVTTKLTFNILCIKDILESFLFFVNAFSILYITIFIGIIAPGSMHVADQRGFASRNEM